MKKWENFFNKGPIHTHSEAEMIALGRRMAAELAAGDVLGFVGDLGAGKTHLIQGLLEGLGCSDPAASPTFSLVHEHGGGRLRAAHFDFYRMRNPDEALGIGWDEYLSSKAVLLVEWADRFDGELMPEGTHWLVLRHEGPSERSVALAGA
ncbi:MAG TPA: tRNA (adenosine(37)-N6)-threonylcarbamoyltransferase complex ATPase subunit type 1 TsaE [Candidatus Akkermansia intestinigallinarum]|mgnify:CR=1 FL=1|uniref:tRNA threonylcarbamoyladenosine biosynthesis protein TsaE n=1 Tax=Candidatus Akkermansia intestinigallinarum TaxID=2838431 RepID=A0A9D2AHF7_9BACT|nr:tRNA (adenosine(37)-N6)-threonylcarbamoyltransferase complex ATPase subunit type 1 TsaE [Candidatus Akkermansia intestinigallinarum]